MLEQVARRHEAYEVKRSLAALFAVWSDNLVHEPYDLEKGPEELTEVNRRHVIPPY